MPKVDKNAPPIAVSVPQGGWSVVDSELLQWNFSPVSVAEMAYAMDFFVGFAQGQCPARAPEFRTANDKSLRKDALDTADTQFLNTLCRMETVEGQIRHPGERTLDATFHALCAEYRGNEIKHSICARVLGFHLLMQRTGGSAVQRWMVPCDERPQVVRLDSAVVRALAAIELCRRGVLPVQAFLDMTERLAAER